MGDGMEDDMAENLKTGLPTLPNSKEKSKSEDDTKKDTESDDENVGNPLGPAVLGLITCAALAKKDNINQPKPADENKDHTKDTGNEKKEQETYTGYESTEQDTDSEYNSKGQETDTSESDATRATFAAHEVLPEKQESARTTNSTFKPCDQYAHQPAFYQGQAESRNFYSGGNSSYAQGGGQGSSDVPSEPIPLFIYQGGHNTTKTLHISPNATITELQNQVFNKLYMPSEGQRLVCNAKELRPMDINGTSLTLPDFGIYKESTIQVLPRLLGG